MGRQDHLTPAAREWFKTNLFMSKENLIPRLKASQQHGGPGDRSFGTIWATCCAQAPLSDGLNGTCSCGTLRKRCQGGVDVVTRRCTTIVYDLIHKQRHPGPSEKAILKWCEMKLAKAHSDAYRDELQAACSFLGKPQKMTITDLVSPAVSKALEAVVEKNWIIIPYKGALVNVARADNLLSCIEPLCRAQDGAFNARGIPLVL